MVKGSPAVIVKSKGTMAGGQKHFGSFIGYIGRNDAFKIKGMSPDDVKKELLDDGANNDYKFKNYIFYQKNPLKSDGIFDLNSDHLNAAEIKQLVKKVNQAQGNGSALFQDVISFDNKFLEKNGIYNSTTGKLNDKLLKNIVRVNMKEFLDNEGFRMNDDNTIVAAAIHRNTDNIHVHFATTEIENTRQKGIFKFTDWEHKYKENGKWHPRVSKRSGLKVTHRLLNINKLKVGIADGLMNEKMRSYKLEIFKNLDKSMNQVRTNSRDLIEKHTREKELSHIIDALPDDSKKWRAKSNSQDMKVGNKAAFHYVDNILNNELKPEYDKFNFYLMAQNDLNEELFGDRRTVDSQEKDKRLRERLVNGMYKNIAEDTRNLSEQLNKNSQQHNDFGPKSVFNRNIGYFKKRKDNRAQLNIKRKMLSRETNPKKYQELKDEIKFMTLKNSQLVSLDDKDFRFRFTYERRTLNVKLELNKHDMKKWAEKVKQLKDRKGVQRGQNFSYKYTRDLFLAEAKLSQIEYEQSILGHELKINEFNRKLGLEQRKIAKVELSGGNKQHLKKMIVAFDLKIAHETSLKILDQNQKNNRFRLNYLHYQRKVVPEYAKEIDKKIKEANRDFDSGEQNYQKEKDWHKSQVKKYLVNPHGLETKPNNNFAKAKQLLVRMPVRLRGLNKKIAKAAQHSTLHTNSIEELLFKEAQQEHQEEIQRNRLEREAERESRGY